MADTVQTIKQLVAAKADTAAALAKEILHAVAVD